MAGAVATAAAQGLVGWSTGFRYTINKGKEDEIRQGGNHVLASFAQAGQVGAVSMVVDKLANFIPNPIIQTTLKVFTNLAPILSIPGAIFCGVVRDRGNYQNFAAFVNQFIVDEYLFPCLRIPERIEDMSPWVVKTCDFLAEHAGDIMQGAMVIGSIALIALGSHILGGCILGALVYQVLDERLGIIPRKVSLFMETYMPIVSWTGILIAGNPVLQVMAAFALITYIPGVFPYMMEKLDHYVCKGLRSLGLDLPGAGLKEIHAPLVENKELTFEQITAVLNGGEEDFELNPAHFSKPVFDMAVLPRDTDFSKLQTFFDRIDWTERYNVIKGKLRDDDRFMDFLVEKFPGVAKEALKENFDNYIERLAQADGIAGEQFLANRTRDQMVGLVAVLKGERRIEGRQQDLADAIESCSMLVPYLERLGPDHRMDFEDTLLALAVEGGFYCGRGVKRITSELTRKLLYHTLPDHAPSTGDPNRDYELRVRQALQDRRAEIVEGKYRWLVDTVLNLPDVVSNDIHGLDIYRLFLSEGFTPLTPYERDQIDMPSVLLWEMYHHQDPFQPSMMREYRDGTDREQTRGSQEAKPIDERGLDEAIHAQGEVQFSGYIERVIRANPKLSADQKDQLVERLGNMAFARGGADVEQHNFHRLMLVMLGVLRPTQAPAAQVAEQRVRQIA